MSHRAAQFRGRIDRELRPAVTDAEWELLVKQGYVGDWEVDAAAAVHDAARFVRDVRRSQRTGPIEAARRTSSAALDPSTPDSATSETAAAFAAALSENVAAIASEDEQVRGFRDEILPGGLLKPAHVVDWVADQYQAQGGNDGNYAIAVGAVAPGWDEESAVRLERVLEVTSRQLYYAIPGATHAKFVSVVPGGILDRLRLLSVGLSNAHGWEPSQATTFVLTGMTPLVGLIRITDGGTSIRHGIWCAWNERIHLDIHPGASPEDVVDVYRAARRRLDRARNDTIGRPRSLSPRHLRVAAFVARRAGTWSDLMDEWNARCRTGDRYTQVSNFRRDARQAQTRVLYRARSQPRA